jgi:hypothetical protein
MSRTPMPTRHLHRNRGLARRRREVMSDLIVLGLVTIGLVVAALAV